MGLKRTIVKGSTTVQAVLTVLFAAVGFVLLILGAFGVLYKVKGFESISNEVTSGSLTSSSADTVDELDSKYTYIDIANSQVNDGDLILVNDYYEYKGDSSDVTNIYDSKNEYYSVSSYDDSARKIVINNLNLMFEGFYNAVGKEDINIISAFRTRELQQQLYNEGDKSYVARPGFSEHETGYAVDLGIYNGEVSDEFDGTGDYAWIQQNCYKYGFILRYPLGMESTTQINYEPWHYRYVGAPHAYYIMQNNICLEQYNDILRRYPYNGEHLIITDFDGSEYEVYYNAMDNEADTTKVPVPKDREYTLSGDNINGFIVTVKNG